MEQMSGLSAEKVIPPEPLPPVTVSVWVLRYCKSDGEKVSVDWALSELPVISFVAAAPLLGVAVTVMV
jgi:hypothetical protein